MTSLAPFPFGITIEVHRATGPARFGDVTYTLHHTIEGCAVAPRYSTEARENSNRVLIGLSLYGPPQAGDNRVFAEDRIKLPDQDFLWRVEGEAMDWGPHPFSGWNPGFEAALERVK